MYQLDANNFIMILSHKWPLNVSDIYMSIFRSSYMLTNSAPDYIPTPQDHSLNTYGITPHAAVKQHIRTPEDGHVNVRNI